MIYERVSEAIISGVLITNFANCAKALFATNILHAELQENPAVIKMQDNSANQLFDLTQSISRTMHQANVALPRTETILTLVQDEVGVILSSTKEVIIQVMKLVQ